METRVPKSVAVEIRLAQGTQVEILPHEGRLIVEPLHPSSKTLEDLIGDVTPENFHAEFDTGPAVGREMW